MKPINIVKDIIGDTGNQTNNSKLILNIGTDENGLLYEDIFPTGCLIAGISGSGRHTFLKTTISDLMERYSPGEVRIFIADPKRLQFLDFLDKPHVEPQLIYTEEELINVLDQFNRELDRRYRILVKERVRYTELHNKMYPNNKLPYWILVADEFGYLVNNNLEGVEKRLLRICRRARNMGIHLFLAVSRPHEKSLTPQMINEIVHKISFKLGKEEDSRYFLGDTKALELEGKGDLLYEIWKLRLRLKGFFI